MRLLIPTVVGLAAGAVACSASREPSTRRALIEALQRSDAGTPADELLANLQSTEEPVAFFKYQSTCRARDRGELLRDALKLRSLQRKLLFADGVLDGADGPAQHRFSVFEFPQAMPEDNVSVTESAEPDSADTVHPDARFDPETCALASRFVPVSSRSDR